MADGSLSQFKATLARKIERNQKRQARNDRNSSSYKSSDSKLEFDFPKLSDSELEQVKKDIRKKIISKRRTELIIFGTILIGLIIYLIINLN
ncbi:hypothetical protein OE09_0587 [Flavobacteriaceae bacterium MAR_2010_72]|nr:hypothetical protein OE09_0587 [Flavobacteriaceae bacterium MAR_2010_72]